MKTSFDPEKLYPLDGSWHPSVATRLSQVHHPTERGAAICKPQTTILLEDLEYDDADDADIDGRTVCKRCLKIRAAQRATATKA